MDENQGKLEMTEFSLSDAVLETADSFSAVARNSGKTLDINVQNGIFAERKRNDNQRACIRSC